MLGSDGHKYEDVQDHLVQLEALPCEIQSTRRLPLSRWSLDELAVQIF